MGNPDFEKEKRPTVTERVPKVSEIYAMGRENLKKRSALTGYFHKLHQLLKQIISQSKLSFIVKGVLSVRDAEQALALGATAIIVSNHASGSFNFSVPSMIALPKIVQSVGDKLTVLIDTGFENGEDVFKALAFGAKAVGFGISMILAQSADGSKAVKTLVDQITATLARTMAATGCSDLSALNKLNKSLITEIPFRT
jgi:isopentenyl diphosphate isomerase/L-lactate dehydrogenase-like FMN-dependent dehydrogenase